MKAKIFQMLLNGELVASSLGESVLKECGTISAGGCNLVFSLALNSDGFSEADAKNLPAGESIAQRISSELSKSFDNIRIYTDCINGDYAGVMCFPKEPSAASDVLRAMERLCLSLKRTMYMEPVCAVSPLADDASQLSSAYDRVTELMNFHYAMPGKYVYSYDEDLAVASRETYRAEDKNRLVNAVCSGAVADVTDIISSIVNSSYDNEQINLGTAYVLTTEIINTLIEIAGRITAVGGSEYKKLCHIPDSINSISRLKKAVSQITGYALSLCELYADACRERKKQKWYYIAEYIEQNYMNPELNVNMIAEEFHIDRSWMSKKFKDAFGMGVFEYIVSQRLEKAKALLATDMNISCITLETGFANSAAFRYNFRKYEGTTPTRYRETIIK